MRGLSENAPLPIAAVPKGLSIRSNHMLSKKWNARLLTVTGMTMLGLGGVSVIHAGTQNANLPVTATVSANCAISTAAVAFGAYDPAVVNASAARDANGTVNVTCTSGASTTVTLDDG